MSACSHSLNSSGEWCTFCGSIVPIFAVAATDQSPVAVHASAASHREPSGTPGSPFDSGTATAPSAAPTPPPVTPPTTLGRDTPQAALPQTGLAQLDLFVSADESTGPQAHTPAPTEADERTSRSLPADTNSTPRARNSDPQTAHQAAARARSTAALNRDRCLIAHADAGDEGLTGEELAAATGLEYATIGPRRPRLEDDGLLVKGRRDGCEWTRPNARGNAQQVYVATAAGLVEAARLRAMGVAA